MVAPSRATNTIDSVVEPVRAMCPGRRHLVLLLAVTPDGLSRFVTQGRSPDSRVTAHLPPSRSEDQWHFGRPLTAYSRGGGRVAALRPIPVPV